MLYKKDGELTNKQLIIRLIIACSLVTILVNTALNTLWLVIMYNKAFIVLFTARIAKEIIMLPIEVVTMFTLMQALKQLKRY